MYLVPFHVFQKQAQKMVSQAQNYFCTCHWVDQQGLSTKGLGEHHCLSLCSPMNLCSPLVSPQSLYNLYRSHSPIYVENLHYLHLRPWNTEPQTLSQSFAFDCTTSYIWIRNSYWLSWNATLGDGQHEMVAFLIHKGHTVFCHNYSMRIISHKIWSAQCRNNEK